MSDDAGLPVGQIPPVNAWFDPLAAQADRWRRDRTSAVFEPVQPLRELVAVVSDEVLAESDGGRAALLLGLLHDPTIRLLRYADHGPPPDVDRREVMHFGEVADGWLMVHDAGSRDGGSVVFTSASGVTRSRIGSSEAVRFAASDGAELYFHLGSERAARAQAERDALCAVAAEAAGADLLITRRRVALDPPFSFVRGPLAVLSPEDALPIVGLYLRRQGSFVVWRGADGVGTSTMNRGLFYLVAARDQLPSGWRWMSRCAFADQLSGDQTLSWLGTSLMDRVVRSLEARDQLHCALSQPQDNDIAGDALMFLDLILVSLMGAFDAAARVAHIVLEQPENDLYRAAWQADRWRRRWSTMAPGLAEFLDDGGRPQTLLTVLRLLRNSVHGEALSPLSISMKSPQRRDDTLVGLPRRERVQLEDALGQLGGLGAWGIREMIPDRLHADARVLVERLVPAALAVLDGIMQRTPVERLPVAPDADLSDGPPSGRTPFAAQTREAIRWQLGLREPTTASDP